LTQLEFNLARRLDKPILLFVMGEDHPTTRPMVETDPAKLAKLEAFKADAKRMTVGSEIERVYAVFESYDDFRVQATQATAALAAFLEEPDDDGATGPPEAPAARPVDHGAPIAAPDLQAIPRYAGSHQFVGRAAELDALDDWARAANPHPVLLFEAIGGTGKSMLTWRWLNQRAPEIRSDWAGRFWYSFYERGADMTQFLRHAVAYVGGHPLDAIADLSRSDLADVLIAELEARPWLLVLDGLERILVAYHRIDAAHVRDEDAGQDDAIGARDVRSAIRDRDDELLRRLATSAPSKVLITTRIAPRSLLNTSELPIQGVRREVLQGLRPADAEALLRSCGVRGSSVVIQPFLQRHCDSHPLVVGALAGLVRDYLPARGDFDAWAADPRFGGQLDLAELDLAQKRNHILEAAISAVDQPGRQLLSALAFVVDAADNTLLSAFNPHQGRHADRRLTETVTDLEARGLLQFDTVMGTYDLHPVVRALSFASLGREQRDEIGQLVVDHFSRAPQRPYHDATELEHLAVGISIVRTYLQMAQPKRAYRAYRAGLGQALLYNVQTPMTTLELLQPFFPDGWTGRCTVPGEARRVLWIDVGSALHDLGFDQEDLELSLLTLEEDISIPLETAINLYNMSQSLENNDRLCDAVRVARWILPVAGSDPEGHVQYLGRMVALLIELGQLEEAEQLLAERSQLPVGGFDRGVYRDGENEVYRATLAFASGTLTPDLLDE
ncbi:MAG TPA: hypothetical protein VF728_02070, partial [Nocardioides sp.]